LGNIVDSDLARESAKLTSQQVQQLSVQALGIANQRMQSLLGLFR
jgi:flagellin